MKWPLMLDNINRNDIDILVQFLNQTPIPRLTNGNKVLEFEKKWSSWLNQKYSIFVNSGSSANILTFAVLKNFIPTNKKEIIVSPLNWCSDIYAILHAGFTPVFCDINLKTLALDESELLRLITEKTGGVLLTHILGYNGITDTILNVCRKHNILLIEDCCESHGATFNDQKIGTFGLASNFSFYYAHHLSTIEGGMICTDSEDIYENCRILRSHGMLREAKSSQLKTTVTSQYSDLNPDFIFLQNAYNFRSTEINAVIGINQLDRLDENNKLRAENLKLFLSNLDPKKFYTDFELTGNSNYAFTLLLQKKDLDLRDRIETTLRKFEVEFRRGMSGGGNQLRQPYLKHMFAKNFYESFKNTEHVHFFGWYLGNYPELEKKNIIWLTSLLNSI